MPQVVSLHATIREIDSHEMPVARIQLTDVLDEWREFEFDLAPSTALDLIAELAKFVRQVAADD